MRCPHLADVPSGHAVLGGIANLMASPRNRVPRGHVEIARAALDKDRERQWQGPMIETPMVHAQAPRLLRISELRRGLTLSNTFPASFISWFSSYSGSKL